MAHPDLDALLDHLLELAKLHLAKRGAFLPFGAVIRDAGKMEMFAAYTGKLTASGLCVDVLTLPPGATSKTDAICAWLEHRNGEAVDVYLPYRKTADGQFEYGQLFANRGGHGVFTRSPGGA